MEEGPAASWEIQAGEGPSMCGPPGRLLLGGNQVDTSLQLGSSTSLPLPESSPLTHSLNKYLSAPTAASGVHFAALGARWVQGVVISPGAGGGGLGGESVCALGPQSSPGQARSLSLARLDVTSESLATLCRWPLGPVTGSVGAWPVLDSGEGPEALATRVGDTELCGRSGAAPPSGLP